MVLNMLGVFGYQLNWVKFHPLGERNLTMTDASEETNPKGNQMNHSTKLEVNSE